EQHRPEHTPPHGEVSADVCGVEEVSRTVPIDGGEGNEVWRCDGGHDVGDVRDDIAGVLG
ncbi:MAG: hypothetical protein AAGF67_17845, partial [Verrucomicrobiota bacterium]